MGAKPRPINILLIDDEEEYCKSLKTTSRSHSILITDFQNLEDGLGELEKTNKYGAAILDARCLLERVDETPSDSFLMTAFNKIQEIGTLRDRHLAIVVNTAHFDEFASKLPKDTKCFEKGKDNAAMFQYLRDEVNRSEEMKIKKKHSKPFEVFEKGHLGEHVERNLMEILKDLKSDDPPKVKKNLAIIRTLLEAVCKEMNRVNNQIVPGHFINGGNVPVRKIVKHLAGNFKWDDSQQRMVQTSKVYCPRHITETILNIYSACSDLGSHYSTEQPTRYTVMSMTHGLCEFLVWFGNWAEEQKTN